ncbi:MAG: TonB-dependent receptor plug domain-containing protein, partial [bacterium]
IEPYLGFGYPHEPFVDANGNGEYDPGEEFTDWDGDGLWDLNSDTENPIWIFRGENHPFRGQRFNGRYIFSDRSGFFKRISTIYTAKIDLTSQVTRHHQIKSGFELNFFNLENISRQLTGPFNGRGLFGNEYDVHPNWQAFYMQDKMEFRNAIVNLGLRVERFDQGDEVAEPDTSSPFIPRFEPPEAKWSVLPRIGFSFPVTEKDVFFFNYGRFFQRPQLTRVFNQVNQPIDSPNSIVGNPNLDPEETISYEFGIRHEFGLHTLLTITGFFKDIDNLLQINQQFDEVGNVFRTYFNDTYGTVKGFELNLIQRAGQFFSGEVSYTFQVAKTTHSTARRTYTRENIFAQLPGTEFPADWDQRHRFVFNIDYHYRKGEGPRIGNFYPLESWNMNILATIASGLPYTPEAFNGTPKFELTNTKRFPWTFDIDVRMRRFFDVVGLRLGAVIEIENLLNRRNAIGPDNGGIVDAFRDRIGFFNSGSPDGTRNFGGFENAVPDPRAWSNGRIIRLGFAIEY